MFEAHDFNTAWHLTDIGNLESIAEHGLLSMAEVQQRQLRHVQVGWSQIRDKRQTHDKVLSFVQPYNHFVKGRIEKHAQYRPDAVGLCLLEIDLRAAIAGRFSSTEITSGNTATSTQPVRRGPITKFADILDWGALLAWTDETVARIDGSTADQRRNAGQSEILLPSPVPRHAIRRVLMSSTQRSLMPTTGLRRFETLFADRFFKLQPRSIPAPAVGNFRIEWSGTVLNGDILNAPDGEVLGNIGTRLLVYRSGKSFQVSAEPWH